MIEIELSSTKKVVKTMIEENDDWDEEAEWDDEEELEEETE
jgi:hypothetical protein